MERTRKLEKEEVEQLKNKGKKKIVKNSLSSSVFRTRVPNTCSEHVPFSDEGPLLETVQFFEISRGSYQPLNFSPYLSLSTQYSVLISLLLSKGQFFNFYAPNSYF